MAFVKIPHEHFIKSAKAQYSNINLAMIREAVQNSFDAGSKNIQIITHEDSVEFIDDGCGMNEEILVNAMLTMSGSHKSASAIGGFGAAKEILLFQHDSYFIHTQDNIVHGKVLEYQLSKGEHRQGTYIKVTFHPSYEYNKSRFDMVAAGWLSECDFKDVKVTLNGYQHDNYTATNLAKELDWGNVYCDDNGNVTNNIVIRIKGVKMFHAWVEDVKKRIVIEITKPSTSIMTSNRDGFQYAIGTELQKLVNEISIDKESFGRCFQTITKFTGDSRGFISNIIEELDTAIRYADESVKQDLIAAKEAIQVINVKQPREEVIQAITRVTEQPIVKSHINIEEIVAKVTSVDFYIQINDKGYNDIPKELNVATMQAKYKKLAKLWKSIVAHVLESNYIHAIYCVGFIVDEKVEAQYVRKDGINVFFVNPYKEINKDKQEMVYNMIMSASHEAAHMSYKYHDENFCSLSQGYMVKALSKLKTWRKLLDVDDVEI